MKYEELKEKSQIFFTVYHNAGDKFSQLKVLNTKRKQMEATPCPYYILIDEAKNRINI